MTEALLGRGYRIYGWSRRGCGLSGNLDDVSCDLSDFDAINPALENPLGNVESLDLAVLNARVLGRLQDIADTTLDELRQ